MPLNRLRHTDGKGFAPSPSSFGDESAERLLFAGEPALGRRIRPPVLGFATGKPVQSAWHTVIGVFADPQGAKDVAARVRSVTGQQVNVLSDANGAGSAEPPALECSRLSQQIRRHLSLGATVVVVDAQGPEQQLGVSRLLLESKCDMLLTHDGPRHAD